MGLVAPAGTPVEVVNSLQKQIAAAIAQPAVKQRLIDFGVEPVGNTPREYTELLRKETVRWHRIIKDQGISLD